MARVALLIGSTRYEKGFLALPAVAENLRRLGEVLGNPEIGGFAVETLLDPDHGEMRVKLETWLRERHKEDVALLYLTGHGVKDRERKLYFAATDTRKPNEELITSTAVAAADLRSYLRQSRASKQIVILDCCFSGAFGDLVAMDDGSVDVGGALLEEERPGRVVLTSSSSMEYSFVEEGASLSLYSQYLIEGLETGAADMNDDEAITADELHRYVSRKVTEVASSMTPKIFVLKDEGYHVRIAKVPMGDPRVRYRKEVEVIVQEDEGEISFINRECLQLSREAFGLNDSEADAIERQVLEPIRQRRVKEERYYGIFVKAIEQHYPLRERDQTALMRLKKRLGLQTVDYEQIEQRAVFTKSLLQFLNSDPHQPEPLPQPLSLESTQAKERPLKTDKADYTKLRDLLASKQWRKADEETYRLMITTAGKKEGQWLDPEDLREFSCEDLRILDRLWAEYSNGHFGFSIQKKIWQECNSPTQYNEDWKLFCNRVGWYMQATNDWLLYGQVTFDINSLQAHLPSGWWGGGTHSIKQLMRAGVFFSLASRLVKCNL